MAKNPILEDFGLDTGLIAKPIDSGLINSTYALSLEGQKEPSYILQKINKDVFKDPLGVQSNIARALKHLSFKKNGCYVGMLATREKKFFSVDTHGDYWRVFHFVKESVTLKDLENSGQAYEVGRVLGEFHSLLLDLPSKDFKMTIKGFHDTSSYLESFQKAVKKDPVKRAETLEDELGFLVDRAHYANQIEILTTKHKLSKRLCHGDPKLSNILFDKKREKALCLIDFDTVMPGYWLHDFGDLVRSAMSCLQKEGPKKGPSFCEETYQEIKKGYLSQTLNILTEIEKEALALSALIITYELCLRFLTDYLNGDVYFSTSYKEQNLDRFKEQQHLLASMETLAINAPY